MPRKKLRYLCHATCNGRTIAGPHPDPNETAEFPVYSPAERQADMVVHIVGLTLGLAGCAGLASLSFAESQDTSAAENTAARVNPRGTAKRTRRSGSTLAQNGHAVSFTETWR